MGSSIDAPRPNRRMAALAAAGAVAAMPPTPVDLGKRDSAQLAALACTMVGGQATRISAWRIEPGAEKEVDIACATGRIVAGKPWFVRVRCGDASGRWICRTRGPALELQAPNGPLLLGYADGMPPGLAVEIASHVMQARFLNGIDLLARVGEACAVDAGRAGPFPGATTWAITCEGFRGEVTRDCGSPPCRMFIAWAQEAPRWMRP